MLINVFFSKLVSKLSGEICPCGDYNACLKLSRRQTVEFLVWVVCSWSSLTLLLWRSCPKTRWRSLWTPSSTTACSAQWCLSWTWQTLISRLVSSHRPLYATSSVQRTSVRCCLIVRTSATSCRSVSPCTGFSGPHVLSRITLNYL